MSGTLYRAEVKGEGVNALPSSIAVSFEPVGEFHKILWCETHDAEGIENHGGKSDEGWRVVWVGSEFPEAVPYGGGLCRIVELLVEST